MISYRDAGQCRLPSRDQPTCPVWAKASWCCCEQIIERSVHYGIDWERQRPLFEWWRQAQPPFLVMLYCWVHSPIWTESNTVQDPPRIFHLFLASTTGTWAFPYFPVFSPTSCKYYKRMSMGSPIIRTFIYISFLPIHPSIQGSLPNPLTRLVIRGRIRHFDR